MSRIQLALNVPDLAQAVSFYTTLLGTPPHKERDGYANFAVEDPPLKLVLFENDEAEQLNHLGIEYATTDEVATAIDRLADGGVDLDVRTQELCCHAVQDKAWMRAGDTRWEVYTVVDDQPEPPARPVEPTPAPTASAATCC